MRDPNWDIQRDKRSEMEEPIKHEPLPSWMKDTEGSEQDAQTEQLEIMAESAWADDHDKWNLTTEQQLRSDALFAAVKYCTSSQVITNETFDVFVLADEFAVYIKDGTHA